MPQESPKTCSWLTFVLGMLVLLTASFGFALARKNNIIKDEKRGLAEKVNQLEEKLRVVTHSKEELEIARISLAADIEQLRLTLEQQSRDANLASEPDLEDKKAEESENIKIVSE